MGTDGDTSASSATPVAVAVALSAVTALGVSPAEKASAANSRPRGRLTKREYSGAPAAPFCAADSRESVSRSPCGGGVRAALGDRGHDACPTRAGAFRVPSTGASRTAGRPIGRGGTLRGRRGPVVALTSIDTRGAAGEAWPDALTRTGHPDGRPLIRWEGTPRPRLPSVTGPRCVVPDPDSTVPGRHEAAPAPGVLQRISGRRWP